MARLTMCSRMSLAPSHMFRPRKHQRQTSPIQAIQSTRPIFQHGIPYKSLRDKPRCDKKSRPGTVSDSICFTGPSREVRIKCTHRGLVFGGGVGPPISAENGGGPTPPRKKRKRQRREKNGEVNLHYCQHHFCYSAWLPYKVNFQ